MTEKQAAELRASPTAVIVYKTYTPQRAAYCKTYYQEHKAKILERKKQQYSDTYDSIKHTPEYKEKKKKQNETYMNKIKSDPEKLEKMKQYKKQYYDMRKKNELILAKGS